jgi:hypothetical protein
MATTTGGLPYPVGTDLVRDGDNAIQALAVGAEDKYGPGPGSLVTQKVRFAGGAQMTGADGRIWVTMPGVTTLWSGMAGVKTTNKWGARVVQTSGSGALVEVYDLVTGNPIASSAVDLFVIALGS